MAADFSQERKWRTKTARMLSLGVVNHHKKQKSRQLRQLKVCHED